VKSSWTPISSLRSSTPKTHSTSAPTSSLLGSKPQGTPLSRSIFSSSKLYVLCRRATERKTTPPNLQAAVSAIRTWFTKEEVRLVTGESERLVDQILDVVEQSAGTLNSNDAFLVVLHRENSIEAFASFDSRFDSVDELTRIS
jgi:predicted nucleic acid-binding protein